MDSLYEELLAGLHSIWHRRWIALAVAWAVCLAGWLVVALIPNSYESHARIFIQLDDALAEQVGIGVADKKRDIERIRQTLTSAVNLEKVVRATRLGDTIENPKAMEAAVLKLGKNVKVVSQEDNLFEITATANDSSFSDAENAKLAQSVAQKLIDIFREENLSGNRGDMVETLEFVNQQLRARERELESAESKRTAFEAQHPEMALGGAAVAQRLESARSTLRDIDADLSAAQSASAAIDGQLAGTPRTIAGGAADGGAQSSLARAQADLAAMRARGLTENHPDVIAAKNQVAALRAPAAQEAASGGGTINPAYSSLQSIRAERQASVQALQSRKAATQSDIASLTASAISDPELATQAQRINRDYDVLRQQYDKLLQDREELRLRGEVKTEREAVKFQVVDPPTSPRTPVAPNRPVLLLGVLIVGFAGGCAGAFALSRVRSVFATTAGLEKATGLPVLGAISHSLTDRARALRAKRLKYFYAGTAALCGLFVVLLAAEFIQRGMVA
ncbi:MULTISPECIES: XrtA system polysaccharide chain length determinant [Sphingomonadaceae]|jgi:polysaccharide chain length determinant protein (PEP-CTERM system associated)|uniref:Chain-length determining protein n=1 Tax=Novosphingobium resinovorum TaxID=158500 RepID=A0A031K3W6_9SPHN|nr:MULTISPECIES: XrtA system polysaccharide chain length determinant [Sphingomonadaceae]AOR76206.1 chain-length determining protein [Novosphingobium resinovorum]EJU13239.1 lipopolysaccharide biosynthesis protein [Sphingomonas sp. LH128]EZP83287.1 Lipopolysaccharide biosynthesis protein [Novosphingobium resinovorum]MBF7011615.1 chain-length determining protein [Novosphingobium sp. HR1a]WJM26374.1 GNVR domain-containing protein [Novosphingobium resinovorum]